MEKHVFYFELLKMQGRKGMKILLVVMALLMVTEVWGQGWIRVYEGAPNVVVPFAAPTMDGGFLVATRHDTQTSSFLRLFKTNSSGDVITEKYITVSGFTSVKDLKALSDGGFVLVGGIALGGFSGDYHYVLRLNAELETIWSKNIPTSGSDIASIEPVLGGGFVYVDRSYGSQENLLIRLNSAGDESWRDTLSSIQGNFGFYDVTLTVENQFISVGSGWHSSPYIDSIYLVKTDNEGQTIFNQSVLGDTLSTRAWFITPCADGGYIVGGDQYSIGDDIYSPILIRVDNSGNLIWAKKGSEYGSAIRDIKPLPNGGYVLLGSIYENATSKIILIKINQDGDIIWKMPIYTQASVEGTSLMVLGDGSIAVCGYYVGTQDSIILIKTDIHGNIFSSALTGIIHQDPQSDCLPDPAEPGLFGWLVQVEGAQSFAMLTDSLGQFTLPVDTGSYTVTITPSGPYWEVCNSPTTASITTFYDTLSLDFPAQAIADCPYMTVDISAPFLRRCFDNYYYVHYCNDGTATAEDAIVEVTIDPYFTYISSTLPLASQNGNTLTFDLGDVAVGDCGNFQITVYLDCDSTILGQTHCTSAHIIPDSLCLPPDPIWDGSSIEVDATCSGDSVIFTITNVGAGGMPAPLGFIIIEDQIVLLTNDFQLGPGQSMMVTVPSNGTTLHLEAQQAAAHPSGFASTGSTIEGCGGWLSLGFFTQWSFDDDPDPFTDVDCQASIGSYDPNDKQGFPTGLGDEHLIEPGQDIEYLIRFQNTGTDTAFKVMVVDVLPPELDLATVRPGASSHPYTYGVTPEGWLTFTFDNIQLPDSTTNEAASHGFIRFRASQRPGLSHGNVIANTALIYFDFNVPVQTNTYKHRIGQVFPWSVVGTTPPVFQPKTNVKIVPNPLTDSALLQVEGIEPGPLKLVLTDVSGKVLHQQAINGTGFEFQRGELAPGMYFFQIERNGERMGSGKLMVR